MAAQEDKITLVATIGDRVGVVGEVQFLAQFSQLSDVVHSYVLHTKSTKMPVDGVDYYTLLTIKEWTERHNYSPPTYEEPVKPVYPKSYANKNLIAISDEDKVFLDTAGHEMVFKLVKAANTLFYKSLYAACTRYLASQIKGKKAAEVGEMFKPAMLGVKQYTVNEPDQAAAKRLRMDTSIPSPSGITS